EAALFERQRLGFALEMTVGDFADHYAMVAKFVEADDLAFDRGRRLTDNWRAVIPRLEGVVAENAGLLDQRMRGRVALDSDHHQRRLEARLGEPVDGRDGLLITVARAQHEQ